MAGVILAASFYLFFFQVLTAFVAGVYSFGLMRVGMPPEIVAVVFLLSPFLLVFCREKREWLLPTLLGVVAAVRLALPVLPPAWEVLLGGLGVAAGMMALPLLLKRLLPHENAFGVAWAVALVADFRALGHGVDFSMAAYGQIAGWVVAVFGIWAWLLLRRSEERGHSPAEPSSPGVSLGKVVAAAFGVVSALFLLAAVFAAPAVIVRWGAWAPFSIYLWVAVALFALALGWADEWFSAWRVPNLASLALFWAVIFGLGVYSLQPHLPATPSAYPFLQQEGAFGWFVLFSVVTFGVLFSFLHRFAEWIYAARPTAKQLGMAFGLAAVYLLFLILADVSVVAYDYIPVFGPFWRNRFWLVYTLPAFVVAFALFPFRFKSRVPIPGRGERLVSAGVLAALALVMLALGFVNLPAFVGPQHSSRLRILTLNIQQGYRADGRKGWAEQVALMRRLAPDIIGLQESDTARLNNGNNDLVGYFASKLGMDYYYGPPTASGTFGVAILSRYPLQETRTFYLYSRGEQTALVLAKISLGEQPLYFAVTHLGNHGPMVQTQEVLQALRGYSPLVLVGDFNFDARSAQYRRVISVYRDAWLLALQAGVAGNYHPSAAIDHVFVTPDVKVLNAAYLPPSVSDHPALVVDVAIAPKR